MSLSLTSKCGKYTAIVFKGNSDGREHPFLCVHLSRVDPLVKHWFFDRIVQEEPDPFYVAIAARFTEPISHHYNILTDAGKRADTNCDIDTPREITYIKPNLIGWFCYGDLREAVETFDATVEWLDTPRSIKSKYPDYDDKEEEEEEEISPVKKSWAEIVKAN
jgi:hypothetical protein